MKIGLVLEGGGMRGLYTAGVLDYMMEKGLFADVICGTSAGVTFGINMPSKQAGRVLRYNTRFAGCKEYISFRSLITSGNIVNTGFAYDRLPNELDPFDYEAFKASGTEFYATVTNCRTGQPEYMRIEDCKRDMDIIRASASLPFLSQKVALAAVSEAQGETADKYLDGGITDNIPLDKCLEAGCEKIIVILTHPEGFIKHENLYWMSRIMYPRNKALQEAFRRRDAVYNAQLARVRELAASGRLFVFCPSRDITVGRLEKDPSRLIALHALGREDAAALWGALENYLG